MYLIGLPFAASTCCWSTLSTPSRIRLRLRLIGLVSLVVYMVVAVVLLPTYGLVHPHAC